MSQLEDPNFSASIYQLHYLLISPIVSCRLTRLSKAIDGFPVGRRILCRAPALITRIKALTTQQHFEWPASHVALHCRTVDSDAIQK
ncbi:hypothetical protein TSMEX_002818 [Taenia solium]|eukprot:TsM_001089200 transcript=TsM_001089200 gene=TsM_001089200